MLFRVSRLSHLNPDISHGKPCCADRQLSTGLGAMAQVPAIPLRLEDDII